MEIYRLYRACTHMDRDYVGTCRDYIGIRKDLNMYAVYRDHIRVI